MSGCPIRCLIEATEKAIQELVECDCSANMPLIASLEDAVFQFWVESNTAFLEESLQTNREEDTWFWDNSCLRQRSSPSPPEARREAVDDTKSRSCWSGRLRRRRNRMSDLASGPGAIPSNHNSDGESFNTSGISIRLCDESLFSVGFDAGDESEHETSDDKVSDVVSCYKIQTVKNIFGIQETKRDQAIGNLVTSSVFSSVCSWFRPPRHLRQLFSVLILNLLLMLLY